MTHDIYEGFAERYDLFHGEFDRHTPLEVDFFRKLLAENQVHSVLDCACGTGRHLHLLHTLGCEVVGSDISPSMLAQAKRNLAARRVEVPLYQIDYRRLPQHFDMRFDAVVCLSSSILHMPDEPEVVRAYTSMRSVLRSGGLLVLTQGTTDRQWQEKPRFILVANTPEFARLFVIDYLGTGARYNVLDIYRGEPDGALEVWSIEYAQVLLRDDHAKLLAEAGFRAVDFWGSYSFDPYDRETSRLLIAVARK